MFGGNAKLGATLVVVVAFAITTGVAGAQDRSTGDLRSQASDLEADLRRQEAVLDRKVRELTRIGSELDEAQAKADAAEARVQDLAQQTRNIVRDLESQKRAAIKSRATLEVRLTAAYKGHKFQSVVLLLEGLLGGSDESHVLGSQAVRILTEDQKSIQHYRENQRLLRNTVGQFGGSKAQYEAAREEQRARAEELARREAELEGSIGELRTEKGRTEGRLEELAGKIQELEAKKEAGLLDPPASGAAGESREEELRIAREEIVVEPVEELPLSGYRRLYKQAAEDYGFGPDWYVLMAVGKVESNHGENMGPSSAGAMGPMQFMPSTWETSGVDGNGDGVPNIMDPEDAIPAGAKYLADNGAPEDWYSALFAYNGAGWYVREVLEVAEQYRLLAGDDSVGPYGFEGPAPGTTPATRNAPQPAQEMSPPTEEIERPAREPKPAQEIQEQTEPERTTQHNSARTVSQYQY